MYHNEYLGRMTIFKEFAWKTQTQPDHLKMNNVPHKNTWNSGMTQDHVESSATPLIKINHDDKLDKYFVNLKLGMHKMSDI